MLWKSEFPRPAPPCQGDGTAPGERGHGTFAWSGHHGRAAHERRLLDSCRDLAAVTIDDFNIIDDVAACSARRPSHPALVAGDRIIDYAALEALVARGAGWLAGRGIGLGSSVAICITDPVKHVVVTLALARVGATQFGFMTATLSNAAVTMMIK